MPLLCKFSSLASAAETVAYALEMDNPAATRHLLEAVREGAFGLYQRGQPISEPQASAATALIEADGKNLQNFQILKTVLHELIALARDELTLRGRGKRKTGLPGRPTLACFAENEFKMRAELGAICGSLAEEADYLCMWHRENHPDERPITPGTIQNRIRGAYREAKAHKNKSVAQFCGDDGAATVN